MEWLKSRLIDDWRKALSFSSVRLHVVAAVIALIYQAMPALDPAIAAMLPAPLQAKAIGAYAIIGLLLRITKLKSNAAR